MSGPIRKKSCSVEFKLQVVSKTETSSIRAAAREAGVDEKRVREWKKQEMELEEMMKKQGKIACKVRKRLSGALHVRVLRRDVARFAKDIITSFKASPGWISRFMRRHKFVTRVKTTAGQSLPKNPADVSWNAPFKARYRDLYTAWMSAQNHERTKAGNLRAPSKALMVDWVLRSWESLSSETIRHSFDVCGVTSCSDPKVIHCTKEGGLENDAHQRLVKFMQSPPDADDSEEDESEVDDEWSLTQGSDNEDGLDGVEDSEDEVVDSHELD
eukprot:Em0010g771a